MWVSLEGTEGSTAEDSDMGYVLRGMVFAQGLVE
jgi:hypothetical protein